MNKVTAPYPYLEPNTPVSEAVPMLSPHRELKHVPDYKATVGLADNPSKDLEEDVTATFYKSSTGSGISNEKLHQDNQIYEDPGCHKETLYSWFEKRKIRKIKIRDIRCTAVSAHNVVLHTCYSQLSNIMVHPQSLLYL